jgi:Activator of Hsp90 ATPase homolog 1-like protein
MTGNDSITVTTVVRTDPATAFRIFTEEIDSWWKRGARYRLHDGAMRFDAGRLLEGDEAIGHVAAWEPGTRLQIELTTWPFHPGERTEVEVRFQAVGDGTRVTVEHRGWKRPTGAAEFRTAVGLWWGAALPGYARATRIFSYD